MYYKKVIKRLAFLLGCIGIVLFFIWSKLLLASILLLFFLDLFTTQFLWSVMKKRISTNYFSTITLITYFAFSIFSILLIRALVGDIYFVPSGSMERTLSAGDYILVNKISYGTKVPRYWADLPVIGQWAKAPKQFSLDRFRQLKSFKKLRYEDIIVFNSVEGHKHLLVKRIIGLPGDSVSVIDSKILRNQKKLAEKASYAFDYINKNAQNLSSVQTYSNAEFEQLRAYQKKVLVRQLDTLMDIDTKRYPILRDNNWSIDRFGPLLIPKRGTQIVLNQRNKLLYERLIQKFESPDPLENGEKSTYTFKKDYYFVLGDNRHHSVDSRSYGLIPEDYIQGKMIRVVFEKKQP